MTASLTQDEAAIDPNAERSAGAQRDASADASEGLRHLVDFVLVIVIAAVVFRGFVAEGYYVPTGSMAPNLLGFHHHAQCPECGYEFDVGIDGSASMDQACCPVCRSPAPVEDRLVESGDRLLVLKWFFDFAEPRRWQTIVFRNPNDAAQAYVKRVVGLPGESIRIEAGDVYVNGAVARKSLDELLSLCFRVYDHDFGSKARQRPSRFVSLDEDAGWRQDGPTISVDAADETKTIAYRHLDDRGREVPIDDFNAYNADPNRPHERVSDLVLRLTATHRGGVGWLELRYEPSASAKFAVRVCAHTGMVEYRRDGFLVAEARVTPWANQVRALTLAYWDLRLGFRIDGQNPFPADFDLDSVTDLPALASTRPFQVSATRAGWTLEHIRIDRDVHYGSRVSARTPTGRRTATLTEKEHFGDEEYRLADGEYFMLGDNSSISNDSRSWVEKAVPQYLLIGKPMFVHLPTRIWRADVFGRTWQLSIPDVSRMRVVK